MFKVSKAVVEANSFVALNWVKTLTVSNAVVEALRKLILPAPVTNSSVVVALVELTEPSYKFKVLLPSKAIKASATAAVLVAEKPSISSALKA